MNLMKLSLVPLILGLSVAGSIASAEYGTEGAWRQNMSPEQQEALRNRSENKQH